MAIQEFKYDAAGRLTEIWFGPGPSSPVNKTIRTYDDANRLTQIKHLGSAGATLYQIDYTWNLNNTVATRAETDNTGGGTTATVTFGYDQRDRLTDETRTGHLPYDYSYT